MFVFCGAQPWCDYIRGRIPGAERLIKKPEELTLEFLEKNKPEKIFFLHWHWKVPKEITDRYYCIGFHSAPLPKFRGGSPILNQIIRHIWDTKLTAFKMTDKFDEGPILCDRDLNLRDGKEAIFGRISWLCTEMIRQIISGNYKERPQVGEPSYVTREEVIGYDYFGFKTKECASCGRPS